MGVDALLEPRLLKVFVIVITLQVRSRKNESNKDDDKFTPTNLTPSPHHSSRPVAAHTDSETPLQ